MLEKESSESVTEDDTAFIKKQYSLPKYTVRLIDRLAPLVGASSDSEVVKLALGYFAWSVDHILQGHEIVVIKPSEHGETRETAVLPQIQR